MTDIPSYARVVLHCPYKSNKWFMTIDNKVIDITKGIPDPYNKHFTKKTKTYTIDGESFKVKCLERIDES